LNVVNVQISVTYLYELVEGDDVIPQRNANGELHPVRQAQFLIPTLTPEAFHRAYCEIDIFRQSQAVPLQRGAALMPDAHRDHAGQAER
jgi:hypothetical protein